MLRILVLRCRLAVHSQVRANANSTQRGIVVPFDTHTTHTTAGYIVFLRSSHESVNSKNKLRETDRGAFFLHDVKEYMNEGTAAVAYHLFVCVCPTVKRPETSVFDQIVSCVEHAVGRSTEANLG